MVQTILRGAYHPVVREYCEHRGDSRIWNRYAVSTALPSSATLASLRSAPIVLHCLYCCLIVY